MNVRLLLTALDRILSYLNRTVVKVNDILSRITNELQSRLSRVSPLMFLLDFIGQNTDEKIIDFSIQKAREQAWNSANLLWSLEDHQKQSTIDDIDQFVLQLSKLIRHPKLCLTRTFLKLMQKFESENISKILGQLKAN